MTRKSAAILAVLALALAPAALAGKGGNGGKPGGGSSSLVLVVLDPDDGGANYGEQVTFSVSTTATAYPYVDLICYQNGVGVMESWRGFFPTSLSSQIFTLGPTSLWQGGAADCTAYLKMSTKQGWSTLASTSFHVYA